MHDALSTMGEALKLAPPPGVYLTACRAAPLH